MYGLETDAAIMYQIPLCESSRMLLSFIRDLHAGYFASRYSPRFVAIPSLSRSMPLLVYSAQQALVEGVRLSRADIVTAIEACVDYPTEVDLSTFEKILNSHAKYGSTPIFFLCF